MKINHNISALKSNIKLQRTNEAMEKSVERLSSGYRINRAADDAAGMAISQKMKTQIRGLDQASRNASDGISVIQTAEGALNEVESMLQRMRELSVQAVNETNTAEDREAIQLEIDNLSAEIDRISEDTEFNTKKLLNGDSDRKTYSRSTKVSIVSASDAVTAKGYKITVTGVGQKEKITAPNEISDSVAPVSGKITINGETIEIEKGSSIAEVYAQLRDLGSTVNVDIYTTDGAGDPSTVEQGAYLNFESKEAGSARKVEVYCENDALADFLGIDTILKADDDNAGKDAEVTLLTDEDDASAFSMTATVAADGNKVTISDKNGFEMTVMIDNNALDEEDPLEVDLTVLDAGPMVLQVGANEEQTVSISIPKVDAESLGIANVNVGNTNDAGQAISLFDKAINTVSSVRAKLGAYENRLEHAISNLDTSNENMTEALSRIEDLDMAEEMSNYTQLNVLSQAGTSMLAQANQMPQNILSLLQ
jgi:flagellin